MTTTATYVTNNAHDTVVIMDSDDVRTAVTVTPEILSAFLLVGDDQDLSNWMGRCEPAATRPDDFGEPLAVNDGLAITILDEDRFAARLRFFGRD